MEMGFKLGSGWFEYPRIHHRSKMSDDKLLMIMHLPHEEEFRAQDGKALGSVMQKSGCTIRVGSLNNRDWVCSQVLIHGSESGVEKAFRGLRQMIRVTFHYDLPIMSHCDMKAMNCDRFISRIAKKYDVKISLQSGFFSLNPKAISISGRNENADMVKEATMLIVDHFCSMANAASSCPRKLSKAVCMKLHISQKIIPVVHEVIQMHSHTIRMFSKATILFPDPQDSHIPPERKNMIVIIGMTDCVYSTYQLLMDFMPIGLKFNVTGPLSDVLMDELARCHPVIVQKKLNDQKGWSIILKGCAGIVTSLYRVRGIILGLQWPQLQPIVNLPSCFTQSPPKSNTYSQVATEVNLCLFQRPLHHQTKKKKVSDPS